MLQLTKNILLLSLFIIGLGGCSDDEQAPNTPPTLTIQALTVVNESSSVVLQATAIDSDGVIESYQWQQISGIAVDLTGSDSETASFSAPAINNDEILEFSLVITDNSDNQTTETVSILVKNVNQLPTLTVIQPSDVKEQQQLSLQATAVDNDGIITDYLWQQTAGSEVKIVDPTLSTITFLLPELSNSETFSFLVTVTDNEDAQVSQLVSFAVSTQSLAQLSAIVDSDISENDTNSSIFISSLDIVIEPSQITSVGFKIKAIDGATAKPIKATYALDKLKKITNGVNLPIFGMYRGQQNEIELAITFTDDSVKYLDTTVTTDTLIEPKENPFNGYTISKKLATSITASYDYFIMKTSQYGPVIMDVDGNVRWQAYLNENEYFNGSSVVFNDGDFTIATANLLKTLHLDGRQTTVAITHQYLTNITVHHELANGKVGYLVEVDADHEGQSERNIESILMEVDVYGNVIKTWDFAKIFVDYLLKSGEDPSDFVRNGIDWFHMNSAIYDPQDNSIIVSSRENFVVKIDYDSHQIKWLFGDESKYWYQNYPALRPLSLTSVDTKPIGQHALSLIDGDLMMFNDGQLSFNQPEGAPKGKVLTSSHSVRYKINEASKMANAEWLYDAGIYSDVCSSVYKDQQNQDGDYLINYSAVNRLNGEPLLAIIQGVNENKELLFEYQFELELPCEAGWNSTIAYQLTDLQIN
ncbi:aryl-sulfate sulfotransferase [Colwelliaceae bacterium BS250]